MKHWWRWQLDRVATNWWLRRTLGELSWYGDWSWIPIPVSYVMATSELFPELPAKVVYAVAQCRARNLIHGKAAFPND